MKKQSPYTFRRNKSLPEADILKVTKLKGKQSQSVTLGIYEAALGLPGLKITTSPDIGDQLGVSLNKVHAHGDYTLLCHLQNFSNQAVDIIIRSVG